MLDTDNQSSSVTTSIEELPCLVQSPTGWLDQYGDHAQPLENDKRRFPRVACGAAQAKAALEYRTTLPAKPRDPMTWAYDLGGLSGEYLARWNRVPAQ